MSVTREEFYEIKRFFEVFENATLIDAAEWFERSVTTIHRIKTNATYPAYRKNLKKLTNTYTARRKIQRDIDTKNLNFLRFFR